MPHPLKKESVCLLSRLSHFTTVGLIKMNFYYTFGYVLAHITRVNQIPSTGHVVFYKGDEYYSVCYGVVISKGNHILNGAELPFRFLPQVSVIAARWSKNRPTARSNRLSVDALLFSCVLDKLENFLANDFCLLNLLLLWNIAVN